MMFGGQEFMMMQQAQPMMFVPCYAAMPHPHGATPQPEEPTSKKKKPILAKRFKTELCRCTIQGRACPYESRCMFAHGQDELRTAEQNLADGLTSEEAIKEWKINTAAAARNRCSAPAVPLAAAAEMNHTAAKMTSDTHPHPQFAGYTTVHPGQIVYLQKPDGALVPTPIASLCWPNGVPLLPLPGGLPVQQMPVAVKNTEPAAVPREPSPESSARSASSDVLPASTPAASRLGVIGGRVFGWDSYTPTAPFLAASLDEMSHALAGAATAGCGVPAPLFPIRLSCEAVGDCPTDREVGMSGTVAADT